MGRRRHCGCGLNDCPECGSVLRQREPRERPDIPGQTGLFSRSSDSDENGDAGGVDPTNGANLEAWTCANCGAQNSREPAPAWATSPVCPSCDAPEGMIADRFGGGRWIKAPPGGREAAEAAGPEAATHDKGGAEISPPRRSSETDFPGNDGITRLRPPSGDLPPIGPLPVAEPGAGLEITAPREPESAPGSGQGDEDDDGDQGDAGRRDKPEPIADRFVAFHRFNPEVYWNLVALALELKESGWQRVGVRMLIERLRWLHAQRTRGDRFQVNNSFGPYYARLIMAHEPALAGFFETRALAVDEFDPGSVSV